MGELFIYFLEWRPSIEFLGKRDGEWESSTFGIWIGNGTVLKKKEDVIWSNEHPRKKENVIPLLWKSE